MALRQSILIVILFFVLSVYSEEDDNCANEYPTDTTNDNQEDTGDDNENNFNGENGAGSNDDNGEGEQEPNPDCARVCITLYSPVCATDKKTGEIKTFSNSCLLQVSNRCDGTNFVEGC